MINRDEKIEEIKKSLYNSRNDLFKPEEDRYRPVRICNVLVVTTLSIKVMEIKIKYYQLKIILMNLNHN